MLSHIVWETLCILNNSNISPSVLQRTSRINLPDTIAILNEHYMLLKIENIADLPHFFQYFSMMFATLETILKRERILFFRHATHAIFVHVAKRRVNN